MDLHNDKIFFYGNIGVARKSWIVQSVANPGTIKRFSHLQLRIGVFPPNPGFRTFLKTLENNNKFCDITNQNGGNMFYIGHHEAHAANAFFSSNFDKSLIITIVFLKVSEKLTRMGSAARKRAESYFSYDQLSESLIEALDSATLQ